MASRSQEGHLYSGRHDHKLCSCKGLSLYTCSGCKQYGANVGFRCHECPDFILHEACATISDEYIHPLYGQDPFHFRSSTLLRHHCDACGYAVKGFVFESRNGHPKLHPLCMVLPRELNYGGHKDHGLLKLMTGKDGKYTCMNCNTMNSNWRYQCEKTACGLSIDFNCAKVDFLKLSNLGIASVVPPSRVKQIVGKISDLVGGNAAQGTVTDLVGIDEDGSSPPRDGYWPPRLPPATRGVGPPPPTNGNAPVRSARTGSVGTAITELSGDDKDGSSTVTTGPVGTATTRPFGSATTELFGANKDGSSTATAGPVGTATTGPVGTVASELFGADKDGFSTATTGPLGTATTERFEADKGGSSTATTGPAGTETTELFVADKDGSSTATTGPAGTETTELFVAVKDASSTATTGPAGTESTELFVANKDGSSTATTGPAGTATTENFGADKDGSSTATTGPVGTATTENFGADKDGSSPLTNGDGCPPTTDADEEDQVNEEGDEDEDADEDDDADEDEE